MISEKDANGSLSIGHAVNLPGDANDDAINDIEPLSIDAESAGGSLILDWGAGAQTRKLSRRVSILGEGHPSLIRLHGLGLRPCELGIICVGTRIWAVQLNPESVSDDQPLVRELLPGGESVWVGNVHIWANQHGSYAQERFGNLPDTQDAAASPELQSTALQVTEPAAPGETAALALQPDPTRGSGLSETLRGNQGSDADSVATHFTDRLIEKTGKRANRKSLIKWGIAGSLLLVGISTAGFVLIKGVLPIFQAIYSE